MEIVYALLSIIIVNLVLSGDNAVVIALASRKLPLGQQKKAIFWGSAGAIILRVILTAMAVVLLKLPFLQLVGGLLLIWIAVKLLVDDDSEKDCIATDCLLEAIKTIITADFLMSLDNVLAVAGVAMGNIPLLIAGLVISIPIIIFGSRIIALLMNRLPLIVYLGAGLLGWTAGAMITGDPKLRPLLQKPFSFLEWLLPLALTLFVIVCGKWLNMRQRKSII